MVKKAFLIVILFVCAIANATNIMGNYDSVGEDVLCKRWRSLEDAATNYIDLISTSNKTAKLSYRHYNDEDSAMLRKWFCDVVSFSMPTNDVDLYVTWLKSKTKLIESAILTQNTDASQESWRLLAAFLADMKVKRGDGDSRQFITEHREAWLLNHRLETTEDWEKWRKAYNQDRRYRTAWSWAAIDTERAIEKLAKGLQRSQRKTLGEIIIEKTGKCPDWFNK